MSDLVLLVATWKCWISRTLAPSLAASLESIGITLVDVLPVLFVSFFALHFVILLCYSCCFDFLYLYFPALFLLLLFLFSLYNFSYLPMLQKVTLKVENEIHDYTIMFVCDGDAICLIFKVMNTMI